MNQNRLPRREAVNAARRAELLNEVWGRPPLSFEDAWEGNFDKNVKRGLKAIVGMWIVGALISLAFLGLVAWGIIEAILYLKSH
jgi:hypothetical protein